MLKLFTLKRSGVQVWPVSILDEEIKGIVLSTGREK